MPVSTEERAKMLQDLRTMVQTRRGDYLDIYFAEGFAAMTGRPRTEVGRMVNDLMKERDWSKWMACESMLGWHESGHTYTCTDMIGFIASHEAACVYCVLIRKAEGVILQ